MLSDHYHPWIAEQGQSPFVWSVIGSIAQATERLRVGTGVTCPLIRMHPTIVAQAAATTAALLPGRFMLGVGTGENLNEHIFGDYWPPGATRRAMLEEAVALIRLLWQGGLRRSRKRLSVVRIPHVTLRQSRRQPRQVIRTSGSTKSGLIRQVFSSSTPRRSCPSSVRGLAAYLFDHLSPSRRPHAAAHRPARPASCSVHGRRRPGRGAPSLWLPAQPAVALLDVLSFSSPKHFA